MARFSEVFEARAGGGLSPGERRLGELLADPPARRFTWEVVRVRASRPVVLVLVPPEVAEVWGVLCALGVDESECDTLTDLAVACATIARRGRPSDSGPEPRDEPPTEEAPTLKERASALVDAVSTLTRATGRLDRVVVGATRELTAAEGALLLAEKDARIDELTPAQRESWRAKAKSRTKVELEFAMGWGVGEVRDLIALAATPASVRAPVDSALRAGEASWRLVRGYVRACAHLPHDLAAGVANALFGTDPSVAATERLTSDREFSGQVWRHREFHKALDREVAKAEAGLDDDQRRTKSREKALQESDVWGRFHEDGTGMFDMRCTGAQLAAIMDRLEGAARRARANGDKRTLAQLRSAIAATLLLHGEVRVADLPDDPALITVEQTEQLAKVLAALPAAVLNVIVPLNHLHPPSDDDDALRADEPLSSRPQGHEGVEHGADSPHDPLPPDETRVPDPALRPPHDPLPPDEARVPDPALRSPHDPLPPDEARVPDPALRSPHDPLPSDTAASGGHDVAREGPAAPAQGRCGEGVFGIGEVQGRRSVFLPPEDVSVLALTPGSTMRRLVTDPVSGRCLERSTKAYPFTAAMKAQIRFADGSCRAPGCVIPGDACQFDHVTEWGTEGGETCEANGLLAHSGHHDQKTKKYLDAVINERRDVTWTTLLGKIYRTKAHDYTQYSTLLREAIDEVQAAAEDEHSEAVDRAIYQALSHRPGGARLVAEDDEESDDHRFLAWGLIHLTRRDSRTGETLNGPAADAVTAERERHRRAQDGQHPEDGAAADGATDGGHGGDGGDGDRSNGGGAGEAEHGPWAGGRDQTPPPF